MGFFTHNALRTISIGENVRWENNSMAYAFNGCTNLNSPVYIHPSVTNMQSTFSDCSKFNQSMDLSNINTTSMIATFHNCIELNSTIVLPQTVTTTNYTFRYCHNFNQPVIIPNSVQYTIGMFKGCHNFNQPINIPNNVVSASDMFTNCRNFNQPLVIPDSVNARGVLYMLDGCTNMSQDVKIYSTIINNAYRFCANKNNSKRLNIFVPSTGNTFNAFKSTATANRIVQSTITWTTMTNGVYNSKWNIYIYNNLA